MRFITPSSPRKTSGLAADVYADIKREFGRHSNSAGNSPFRVHGPAPTILAGHWTALYETVLVEHELDRAAKEAIAAGVSRANACTFCTEAHTLFNQVAAGGQASHDELAGWAAASRPRARAAQATPPFAAAATAEALGTLLLFQYTNRVVDVFLGQAHLAPVPGALRGPVHRIVAHTTRKVIRAPHPPSGSLRLLPDAPLPEDLSWAEPVEHIAAGLSRVVASIDEAADRLLPADARERARAAIKAWDGEEPPFGRDWVTDPMASLPEHSRPVAALAVLTALAPQRIEQRDVDATRPILANDEALVAAVAWAALEAARHMTGWVARPTTPAAQAI